MAALCQCCGHWLHSTHRPCEASDGAVQRAQRLDARAVVPGGREQVHDVRLGGARGLRGDRGGGGGEDGRGHGRGRGAQRPRPGEE